MAKYEIKLRRQLRFDTQTIDGGTVIAVVESDLPIRTVASLILNRGIIVGEPQVDTNLVDEPGQESNSNADGDANQLSGDGNKGWDQALIASLKIDPRLATLLAENNPSIKTVVEAKHYLAERGHFRGVKGIGNAGDKILQSILKHPPAE